MNQFANPVNQLEQPESEISAARRQLDEVLGATPNLISQLEARLQSVLVPQPPAAPRDSKPVPMLSSELGCYLDSMTQAAARNNAALQDILDRLRL